MTKFKTLAAAAIAAVALTASTAAAGVVPDVAAQNGVLTGTVVDASGAPQAGVEVDILRGGRRVAVATTDAQGTYRVSGVTSGTYGVASQGAAQSVRVWNGVAPAGAVTGVAIVAPGQTVNGNHGAYCPPEPCGDGVSDGYADGGYAAGGTCNTTYAPQATYAGTYTTCQPATKRCGSNGFLSNGLSNTAAIAGLALGITGTAIAVDARDEAEHASARNEELAAEVQRRGEIMDSREETIERLLDRVDQLEQELGLGGEQHVTP